MKQCIGIFVLCSLLFAACTKANEATESGNNTGGNPVCDTVNMKYATNVLPIIQGNCYSCHGNGQMNGGISLDSYTNLKRQVSNGKLINVITHASGFPAMPRNNPKLSDCNINKIRSWISRGAIDN